MHGSSKWSLSFGFPHLTVYAFLVCHTCYTSRPSHPPWYDYLYCMARTSDHETVFLSPLLIYLGPKYCLQHPILEHPKHVFFP
jgi:hypothetical protein